MKDVRYPNVKCEVCKKPIYRRLKNSRSGSFFCSQNCYGVYCRKPFPCPVCGKEILAGKRAKTCSRACANKQRTGIKYNGTQEASKVKKSEKIRLFLLSRDGLKCCRCTYDKVEILQIHHVVPRSKGGTNDTTNLQLLCPNCHCELHYEEGGQADISWLHQS